MSTGKYGPDFQMDVFTLSPDELGDLHDALTRALMHRRTVRAGVDAGVKFDFGDGAGWTLPFGTDTTGRP